MPTVFTHALAGVAAAQVFAPPRHMLAVTLLAAGAAALPDIDALGLRVGIQYASALGHRGFTHSILFSGMVAAGTAVCLWRTHGRWRIAAGVLAATASHGLLDALTDGGYGVAFFAPVSETRHFFPWTPIRVAPLRPSELLSRWGADVFASEAVWVWIPAAAVGLAARLIRRRAAHAPAASGPHA